MIDKTFLSKRIPKDQVIGKEISSYLAAGDMVITVFKGGFISIQQIGWDKGDEEFYITDYQGMEEPLTKKIVNTFPGAQLEKAGLMTRQQHEQAKEIYSAQEQENARDIRYMQYLQFKAEFEPELIPN